MREAVIHDAGKRIPGFKVKSCGIKRVEPTTVLAWNDRDPACPRFGGGERVRGVLQDPVDSGLGGVQNAPRVHGNIFDPARRRVGATSPVLNMASSPGATMPANETVEIVPAASMRSTVPRSR